MSDTKILSGDLAIVNQLLPSRHPWAWEVFRKAQNNNWVPNDIGMAEDVRQWRSAELTDGERLLVRRVMGFFAGSESLVANNLLLSIFRVVSDAECRQYILRQAYEEALHNQTVSYVCSSLDLDVKEVYEAYRTVPTIKAKDDFLMGITTDMGRPGFDVRTPAGKREALRNLITYYIVCEGIFFYSGFAMLLSLGRRKLFPGLCEQIEYTLRDESLHIEFGNNLIATIAGQEPEVWTAEFRAETVEHIHAATDLEIAYARDVLPTGVVGLTADLFVEYMRYIANRRCTALGLPTLFRSPKNPFPWLAEVMDLKTQKNFFERRVQEYSVGKMVDDLD